VLAAPRPLPQNTILELEITKTTCISIEFGYSESCKEQRKKSMGKGDSSGLKEELKKKKMRGFFLEEMLRDQCLQDQRTSNLHTWPKSG